MTLLPPLTACPNWETAELLCYTDGVQHCDGPPWPPRNQLDNLVGTPAHVTVCLHPPPPSPSAGGRGEVSSYETPAPLPWLSSARQDAWRHGKGWGSLRSRTAPFLPTLSHRLKAGDPGTFWRYVLLRKGKDITTTECSLCPSICSALWNRRNTPKLLISLGVCGTGRGLQFYPT